MKNPVKVIVILLSLSVLTFFFAACPQPDSKPLGWEQGESLYQISFDSNGGSAIAPVDITEDGEVVGLTQYFTSKQGYDFLGWYLSSDVDQEILSEIRIYQNVLLKALWAKTPVFWQGDPYQLAGPDDTESIFVINPTLNATSNLSNSVLGNSVDGPGSTSSYTGLGWQENGNIRVLPNTNKEISPHVDSQGVFEFFLHNIKDFDGSNTGRQRIEIKGSTSYGNTRDYACKGKEGDIFTYYWKFCLPDNLVDVPPAGFFHIFQIKATVGNEAGAPVTCLTVTRDSLLFRNITIGANMDTTEVIASVPLKQILGKWVSMEVSIQYRDTSATKPGNHNGYIYGRMIDLEDAKVLLEEGKACDMWRRPEVKDQGGIWIELDEDAPDAQLTRPKWGLYRAINPQTQEATVRWADMRIIKRDPVTYMFPDGHDPADAGPIPNRDFSDWGAYDNVTAGNWQTTTKASISHNEKIVGIFDKNNKVNFEMHSNIVAVPEGEKGIPIWLAADMGFEQTVNEIQIHVNGSGVADRFDNFYIAVTSDDDAWNALLSNSTNEADQSLTTLDPLGLHTTDGLYYTGANQYDYADRWKKFIEIPKIVRNNQNGSIKNWSTDEVFTWTRPEATYGVIPGTKEVKGRYIIWYSDPYYPYYGVRPVGGSSSSVGSIQFISWHIKNNPKLESGE